jgi:hypothetical protein
MNDLPMSPLVYEINTRCWLWSLSQRAGKDLTLAEVPEEQFQFWRDLGFTHIWLMGVWRLAHGTARTCPQLEAPRI